jgi:8-oxo-dGTP pyrophosphatase MutT (NUDIX family)
MPIPEYVRRLRQKVGHDLLLLPGIVAVVVDDAGRVLLNRRTDNGKWSLISGILEPDEQPEVALVREVLEATGLTVEVERLVDASTTPVVKYPNGDLGQYCTVAYRCRVLSGEPVANDDESHEVRFFDRSSLPDLRDDMLRCIDRAFGSP